jgi:hypothetical protein
LESPWWVGMHGGGGLVMFRHIAQELLNIEPISYFL